MFDERRVEMRARVLRHLDHFFRPPAWFYEQLEDVIEMAAAGRLDEKAELEGRRYAVKELVDHYDLESLIEELEADALLDQEEWERRRAAAEEERINAFRELGLDPPF